MMYVLSETSLLCYVNIMPASNNVDSVVMKYYVTVRFYYICHF